MLLKVVKTSEIDVSFVSDAWKEKRRVGIKERSGGKKLQAKPLFLSFDTEILSFHILNIYLIGGIEEKYFDRKLFFVYWDTWSFHSNCRRKG